MNRRMHLIAALLAAAAESPAPQPETGVAGRRSGRWGCGWGPIRRAPASMPGWSARTSALVLWVTAWKTRSVMTGLLQRDRALS